MADPVTQADIAGVVRDANGGVLPGVEVTVRGPAMFRTAFTDDRGHYEFGGLPAGRYELKAALPGFEAAAREVVVDPSTPSIDFVLSLSPMSETMTITATRTGTTDVQTTPTAITVLTSDTIEQRGIRTVEGLAGVAPGVTMTQTPGGSGLVSIRGIGTNSFVAGADPSSTVYLDGVYLARPATTALDFMDVERVEVLRGPQGTLYGRNSVGGAIQIVTKQATNELEASARLSAGDRDRLRAEGMIGGPLIKDKLMGNVAVLRSMGSGFVKDLQHPDHSLGGEDTWAGRTQLRIVFSPRSELLISGDYGRFDGSPVTYVKAIQAKPGFTFDTPQNF